MQLLEDHRVNDGCFFIDLTAVGSAGQTIPRFVTARPLKPAPLEPNPEEDNHKLTEILQILQRLQHQHPTATAAEAPEIIEAEFTEIQAQQPSKWQTFRQQLLNRERWLDGGKAALNETAKHYAENSVVYEAGLAFLDAFSNDTAS